MCPFSNDAIDTISLPTWRVKEAVAPFCEICDLGPFAHPYWGKGIPYGYRRRAEIHSKCYASAKIPRARAVASATTGNMGIRRNRFPDAFYGEVANLNVTRNCYPCAFYIDTAHLGLPRKCCPCTFYRLHVYGGFSKTRPMYILMR